MTLTGERVHPAELEEDDLVVVTPHRVWGRQVGHGESEWRVDRPIPTAGGELVVVECHGCGSCAGTVRVVVYETSDYVPRLEHHPHPEMAA